MEIVKGYEQWKLDELLDKEVSITSAYDGDLAIYRVAAISPGKGVTLKFVRQIGGKECYDWCDCCLNLKNWDSAMARSGPKQKHFNWFVKAIKIGHFDIKYTHKHFKFNSSFRGASSCAF